MPPVTIIAAASVLPSAVLLSLITELPSTTNRPVNGMFAAAALPLVRQLLFSTIESVSVQFPAIAKAPPLIALHSVMMQFVSWHIPPFSTCIPPPRFVRMSPPALPFFRIIFFNVKVPPEVTLKNLPFSCASKVYRELPLEDLRCMVTALFISISLASSPQLRLSPILIIVPEATCFTTFFSSLYVVSASLTWMYSTVLTPSVLSSFIQTVSLCTFPSLESIISVP